MCDPKYSKYIFGAGTALSVGGGIIDSRNIRMAGEYNARIAGIAAEDAEKRGLKAEQDQLTKVSQLIGEQRAEFGGRNVQLSGTPLDILIDTARIGTEDANTIRRNAYREAFGIRSQGNEQLRRAKAESKNVLLRTAGSALTGYGQYKAAGK